MLLEEILKQEQEKFIKENLLSDEMLELLKENKNYGEKIDKKIPL